MDAEGAIKCMLCVLSTKLVLILVKVVPGREINCLMKTLCNRPGFFQLLVHHFFIYFVFGVEFVTALTCMFLHASPNRLLCVLFQCQIMNCVEVFDLSFMSLQLIGFKVERPSFRSLPQACGLRGYFS